jgi:outer membrane protein assembly factor BamB
VLVLNGDKLLVVEATFSSYDKLTGVPILENIPLGYERRHYRHDRITLYNNRLFYIGDWNLVSVDADIGKPIWSVSQADIVSGNDEFSSSPLVNNRQVFILHETGLRVYDADTGEFIGVDGSFRGKDGVQSSYEVAVYKDAYIFYNYRLNYVTAIRCKDREEP